MLLKREAIDMSDIIKEIMETSGDKISIFRLLDSEERKKIGEFLELVRYPAGTVCVKEGEKINYIGIIASGKMKFERHNRITDKPTLLAVLEKGSHVGDFSMQAERESLGQLRTVEDSELLVINHDRLDTFMHENPYTGIKILKGISTVLSIRLKSAIDKVMVLS
ncbi:MAG: cyclic nucleotide-binding domain-containing protein [Deltaproteobacteria bacterium]|nr:MAG: cyclic nucleotide-binding domain-containing protein [Deltaproteobacteria bacterium]